MKNINNFTKSFGWQFSINNYEDEEGRGVHGETNWNMFVTGKKGVTFFKQQCQEGYYGVAEIPGIGICGVISFEGSSNKDGGKDWKRNFDTKKVKAISDEANEGAKMEIPYGNTDTKIRCHKGIYEAYLPVRPIVREFAKYCREKGYFIFICGHSLGGGVTHYAYIDLHYLFHTEMEIPMERMNFLTGYACASPACFNWAGAVSFNKRADGNFYNEWYGNDPVHDVPPFTGLGYVHCGIEKRWSSLRDNVWLPFVNILRYGTLGFLPSLAVWDHDPRKGLAATLGKPIPTAKLDSRK